jgi:hypothetical protein
MTFTMTLDAKEEIENFLATKDVVPVLDETVGIRNNEVTILAANIEKALNALTEAGYLSPDFTKNIRENYAVLKNNVLATQMNNLLTIFPPKYNEASPDGLEIPGIVWSVLFFKQQDKDQTENNENTLTFTTKNSNYQ